MTKTKKRALSPEVHDDFDESKITNPWQVLGELVHGIVKSPIKFTITIVAVVFLVVFFSLGLNIDKNGITATKPSQLRHIDNIKNPFVKKINEKE